MASDLHKLLGELRQFVDTVAGDNRPSQEWAIALRSKIDAMPEAALSRTGAVKVKDLDDLVQVAFDAYIPIAGECPVEPAMEAAITAILSALEPAAPEGRQEADAFDADMRAVEASINSGARPSAHRFSLTRPAEQAVTDEMVDAACEAFGLHERKHGLDHRQAGMRAALKAAMEAGRHE